MSEKKFGKVASLLLLSAFSQFSVQAKDSAYMNIHGSVIPSACNLDISVSDVDFTGLTKTIMQDHSEQGVFTAHEKIVPFTITCDGEKLVAISTHADTIPTAGLTAFPTYDSLPTETIKEANKQISLARNGAQKDIVVGTVQMNAKDIITDNVTAGKIFMSLDEDKSWTESSGEILYQDGSAWYSWGRGTVQSARIISGSFIVNVNVDAETVKNMDTALNFSGGTTITLHYI